MSRRFAQSVKLIVLIIGAFVMMFPFVWMLATSLKTLPESVAIPPILLPDTPQWSNYAEALRTAPFGLYFRNSILVAGLGTLLTLNPGAAGDPLHPTCGVLTIENGRADVSTLRL